MVTPDNSRINTNRDTSVTSSQEVAKRKLPTGDFKKVVEEVDQRPKDEPEEEFTFDQKNKKKTVMGRTSTAKMDEDAPLLSPFDLARANRESSDEKEPKKEAFEEVAVTNAPTKKVARDPFEHFRTEDERRLKAKKSASLEDSERPVTTNYGAIEQPDLASVASFKPEPIVAPISVSLPTPEIKSTAMPASVQELIDLIAKEVVSLTQGEDTQTVVLLKGRFENSRVIITESNTAPGQMNITIDNLTAANQALIESNRTRLLNDLIESGVQVQRLTASTIIETTQVDVATDGHEHGQKDDQSDNPRQGKRQKFDDRT